MQKNIGSLLLLFFSSLILGCNQASQQERPICSDEYIQDFNNYYSTLEYVRSQPNYTSKQMLQKQCEIMLIKHNGVNCVASSNSGALVSPDAYAIETNCRQNSQSLGVTISNSAKPNSNSLNNIRSTGHDNERSASENSNSTKNPEPVTNVNQSKKLRVVLGSPEILRPIDLKSATSTIAIHIRSSELVASSSSTGRSILIDGQLYKYSTASEVETVSNLIKTALSKQPTVTACELNHISNNNVLNKQFILTSAVVENSVDSVRLEEFLTYNLTFTSGDHQSIQMSCHKFANKNASFKDIISSSDFQNTFREKVFVKIIR